MNYLEILHWGLKMKLNKCFITEVSYFQVENSVRPLPVWPCHESWEHNSEYHHSRPESCCEPPEYHQDSSPCTFLSDHRVQIKGKTLSFYSRCSCRVIQLEQYMMMMLSQGLQLTAYLSFFLVPWSQERWSHRGPRQFLVYCYSCLPINLGVSWSPDTDQIFTIIFHHLSSIINLLPLPHHRL